jgi:hypothetical protein
MSSTTITANSPRRAAGTASGAARYFGVRELRDDPQTLVRRAPLGDAELILDALLALLVGAVPGVERRL